MTDKTCQQLMWSKDVWHPPRCGRKAKYIVDNSHTRKTVCGIHAKRYGQDAKPISEVEGGDDA